VGGNARIGGKSQNYLFSRASTVRPFKEGVLGVKGEQATGSILIARAGEQ